MTKSMKTQPGRLPARLFAALLLACFTSAGATVIFEDDFDADTYGIPAVSLLNWTIDAPSVDVVGDGGFSHLCNGGTAGNCLDMDGSTSGGSNGQISTKLGFDLGAGDYLFSFDYGNNTFDGNSLAWFIGSFASGIVHTGPAQNNTYTHSATLFSLASPVTGVHITFTGGGTEDFGGTVLDNVRLESLSVPEPASLLLTSTGVLLLLAFGGMGAARARSPAWLPGARPAPHSGS